MTKKLSMTLKLSDYLSHWSGQSHQSCQLKQSALKNFSRGEKLPDFKLKIKNKCQCYVASFGTELITPS